MGPWRNPSKDAFAGVPSTVSNFAALCEQEMCGFTWIFTEFVACMLANILVVWLTQPAQQEVVSRVYVVVDSNTLCVSLARFLGRGQVGDDPD